MMLLMLDYDGTLAPIKQAPKKAGLPFGTRNVLKSLARKRGFRLAVVSGRSLADIKRMVGIGGIIYSGCHGLQIEGPGMQYTHPMAAKAVPLLESVKREFSPRLRQIKGVLIEDKWFTLALHYRRVPPKELADFFSVINDLRKQLPQGLVLCQGRKVFELRPDIAWNKGHAVRLLLKKLGALRPFPVYAGDDLTDEDAFRAIKGIGLSIFVASGERPAKTSAVLTMDSIIQMKRFLQSLI